MKIVETRLDGVKIIETSAYEDHRGYFLESFNKRIYQEHGLDYDFVQDNQSLSREHGVIRGLHYQLNPKAQTKLVRAISGAILDVAVDIRKGSPTYGQWVGAILSEYNKRQLLIPRGFAHGFCTLVPDTIVAYKVDEYYSPQEDRGIRWDDPSIGVEWPVSAPILSDKDKLQPLLQEAEINFMLGE